MQVCKSDHFETAASNGAVKAYWSECLNVLNVLNCLILGLRGIISMYIVVLI